MSTLQNPAPPLVETTHRGAQRTTPPRAPRHQLRWITLLVVLSGIFMSTLDLFIVNVAIPSMQAELGADAAVIQWVVAGFALAVGALVITAGRLGDLCGRRRMYGVGLAAFTLASAACGLAPSGEVLVAARVLQGASAALLMPQVLAILGATFAGAALVRAYTAYGLSMGVAAVFGQLIGGVLIRADVLGTGWRACFLINVPIGLAALVLLRRAVPETRGTGRARLDLVGAGLVTAALVTLALPLIQGREQGWPLWTWLSLVASALLFADFAWHQRRLARAGRTPLLDLAIFRQRTLAIGLAAQLAFSMGLASFFLVFAIFVQDGRGLTALEAGELFASIGLGYLITSTLAGRVVRRLGVQTVALGAAVMVVALLGIDASLGLIGDTGSLWWLAPTLALDGAGMGLVIAPLAMTTLSRVAPEHAGAASGALSTMTQVGAALGVALIGVIFYAHAGGPGKIVGVREGFGASLIFLVAVELVVATLVQFLPRVREDRL